MALLFTVVNHQNAYTHICNTNIHTYIYLPSTVWIFPLFYVVLLLLANWIRLQALATSNKCDWCVATSVVQQKEILLHRKIKMHTLVLKYTHKKMWTRVRVKIHRNLKWQCMFVWVCALFSMWHARF